MRSTQLAHEAASVNKHLKSSINLIMKRKKQKSLVVREKEYAMTKMAYHSQMGPKQTAGRHKVAILKNICSSG